MSIKFHENYLGYKSKLILLSGISLFIALSEALPKEIAILGLDLSGNPSITGWFLVAVSSYFFMLTFTTGLLDIFKYKQPALVQRLSKNLTGDTIGLTEQECLQDNYQPHHLDEAEVGTTHQELQDIQRQKSEIDNKVNSVYQTAYDGLMISIYFVLPVVFFIVSHWYLVNFLILTNEKI
jgi:hypothetical protein